MKNYKLPYSFTNANYLKPVSTVLLLATCIAVSSQTLQLHYDLRHTISPGVYQANYPTLYFEYFKQQDSGHSFVKPGSFLFKMQADMLGQKNNIGNAFLQASQTLRFWQPGVFLHLSYSGGLGVTQPAAYSYYITNTFEAGVAYPFKWLGAYLTTVLDYKYVTYLKPTNDFDYTLYWWRGFMNYKFEFSGDFSVWTENKNHGDALTAKETGKRFFFFAEPQVWYNLTKHFAAGSKTNMYYHINNTNNILQAYPTIAIRFKIGS